MRHFGATFLSFAAFLGAMMVYAQNVNIKQPSDISAQKQITSDEMRDRAAHIQLQKDEKELGALCASISSDMDDVAKGVLPKDELEKLRRLEKLSKRVREQLAQSSVSP